MVPIELHKEQPGYIVNSLLSHCLRPQRICCSGTPPTQPPSTQHGESRPVQGRASSRSLTSLAYVPHASPVRVTRTVKPGPTTSSATIDQGKLGVESGEGFTHTQCRKRRADSPESRRCLHCLDALVWLTNVPSVARTFDAIHIDTPPSTSTLMAGIVASTRSPPVAGPAAALYCLDRRWPAEHARQLDQDCEHCGLMRSLDYCCARPAAAGRGGLRGGGTRSKSQHDCSMCLSRSGLQASPGHHTERDRLPEILSVQRRTTGRHGCGQRWVKRSAGRRRNAARSRLSRGVPAIGQIIGRRRLPVVVVVGRSAGWGERPADQPTVGVQALGPRVGRQARSGRESYLVPLGAAACRRTAGRVTDKTPLNGTPWVDRDTRANRWEMR
jgi:hypothetical protein